MFSFEYGGDTDGWGRREARAAAGVRPGPGGSSLELFRKANRAWVEPAGCAPWLPGGVFLTYLIICNGICGRNKNDTTKLDKTGSCNCSITGWKQENKIIKDVSEYFPVT